MTNRPNIAFRPGWWGLAFSGLIIAVRAFQVNAEPMSCWSWWSWLLMLTPCLVPLYIYIGAWGLYILGMTVLGACNLIDKTCRKIKSR